MKFWTLNDLWTLDVYEESSKDLLRGVDVDDTQTRLFAYFVSIASSFASLNYAQKLKQVPNLILQSQKLFTEMRKEVSQYADIANEVQNLTLEFHTLVSDIKHQANMTLPHIRAIAVQISVVEDVVCNNMDIPIQVEDKRDIDLALSQMTQGVINFQKISKQSMKRCNSIQEKIKKIKDVVQTKKMVVEQIGAGFFVSVVYMVKKLWDKQNYKALSYLNQILLLLQQLLQANTLVMSQLDRSQEVIYSILIQTDQIKLCIVSQRQRRINHSVCTNAIGTITQMVSALEELSEIEVEKGFALLT